MRSTRAHPILGMLGIAVIAGSVALGQAGSDEKVASPEKVGRGKYLVDAMGCHDCHTPKKMGLAGPEFDFTRALWGHPEGSELPPPPKRPDGPWSIAASWELTAWSGPWGVSYATNLTPDENTGIGIWTEEMFIKAMRTGRHMGTSRPILPPMPWQNLKALNDADLSAVFAYLRSLPSAKNRVPDPIIVQPPEKAD